MSVLGNILRTLGLSVLFAGSAAIVFAAIIMVKSSEAHGLSLSAAAASNAPIFIHFSKVALGAAALLLIGESLTYARRQYWNRIIIAQYVFSFLCLGATLIFTLGIVPPLERLLPQINTDAQAHQAFSSLHQVSRVVFGSIILSAAISLVLPFFNTTIPDTKENT